MEVTIPTGIHHFFLLMHPNVYSICKSIRQISLCAGLILTLLPIARAQDLAPTSPTPKDSPAGNQTESTADILREAVRDLSQNNADLALQKVSKVIEGDSQNKDAHLLRAGIYGEQQRWEDADHEYQLVLVMEPDNAVAKFDVADLKFLQKKYDDARGGFAELESNKDLGDIATYKVFLCDLVASHEDVAAADLKALNQAGGTPSYYFGNAAWDIAHNKNEDAAGWLKSAAYIYQNAPQKLSNYVASLRNVGYLPLHPSITQAN
jgi:hypothetical protein